jgi:transposase
MGTQITGGVDTHLEVHVVAALDDHGGLLGTASFATTSDGYRELGEWLGSFGAVVLVGVEGTGSYGTGLTRYLQAVGINVVEVDRPNRQRRRLAGKSDTHDAVSAARAAFAGDALGRSEDPRRRRRSDPGPAIGPQQRHARSNQGVESDALAR